MKREVQPELLDGLPARDPRAMRSRRDLRRLNCWMGHPRIMAEALGAALRRGGNHRLVELGAGDGHFLLTVARRIQHSKRSVEATLVDRLNAHDVSLCEGFRRFGWRITTETREAEEWLLKAPHRYDILINNLFLHQLDRWRLGALLDLASRSARVLIALEPRRGRAPLIFSRLLWFVGCGAVTRHDAVVSVRGGFRGSELSELWPQTGNWKLIEQPVGLFSHLFIAQRRE